MNLKNNKIAIIGLGYVGLPLAIEFGKKYETFGYDIDQNRIKYLKRIRQNQKVEKKYISSSKNYFVK